MHAQSIASQGGLTDIAQGALTVSPHYVGNLTWLPKNKSLTYHASKVDLVDAWSKQFGEKKAEAMLAYDKDVLLQSGYQFAMELFAKNANTKNLSYERQTTLANAFARVNAATFGGQSSTSQDDIDLLQTLPDSHLRQILKNSVAGKDNLNWSSTT
jgi:hypothetical protein